MKKKIQNVIVSPKALKPERQLIYCKNRNFGQNRRLLKIFDFQQSINDLLFFLICIFVLEFLTLSERFHSLEWGRLMMAPSREYEYHFCRCVRFSSQSNGTLPKWKRHTVRQLDMLCLFLLLLSWHQLGNLALSDSDKMKENPRALDKAIDGKLVGLTLSAKGD